MSTKDSLTEDSPPEPERFLIDSDVDPEIIALLKKLGFKARGVLTLPIENEDTLLLIWARKRGYILVCHDKHRDAKQRYSFYSEMYYRGGQVIRISGKPGQDALFALGKILVHRPEWQGHFLSDSGEVVVHPTGCNFTTAAMLFERSSYSMRLTFEDPAIPLKSRAAIPKKKRARKVRAPRASGPLL